MGRPQGSGRWEERRRQARGRKERLDRSRELIRPGAGAKSQVWRVASWLAGWGAIGLVADVLVGSRRLLEWAIGLVVLPFLLTIPYGLARLRGDEGYRPAARLIALRPVQLHVYVLLIAFGRLPMGIGDHLYTAIWRSLAQATDAGRTAPDALQRVGQRPPPERRTPVVVYDDEPTDEHVPPRPAAADHERDLARRYPILFGDGPTRGPGRPTGRSDPFAIRPDRSEQAGSSVARALWRVLGR